MQDSPYLQGATLTWWQKALAVVGLIAALVLTAVVSVIILYVLLFLIAFAFVVGLIVYIRFRFFPAKRKTRRGPDDITIIETPDGVVIDMPPDAKNETRR